MKNFTIKIGQFDVDYGDQHYRRTDGGNTIYNPFVENYIMDEFATELGDEIYYHHSSGLFLMVGITNGELDPTVVAGTKLDSTTGQPNKYPAAFHGKLGIDRQITPDFRFRLTGSVYSVHSANSNTLFGGDRTGAHYFYVMENQNVANGTVISDENDYTETSQRRAVQYAADLIYRFPAHKENFWIGVRYNTAKVALQGYAQDMTIDRDVASAGWLLTRNIMLKAEYVHQDYKNYPNTNILNGGKFYGTMLEASIAF
jgi:hypothetical protein